MKTRNKSKGVLLDEIRLEGFEDPKRAKYAVKLAMEAVETESDVDPLLDTLRRVAQAQGGLTGLATLKSIARGLADMEAGKTVDAALVHQKLRGL